MSNATEVLHIPLEWTIWITIYQHPLSLASFTCHETSITLNTQHLRILQ